MKVILDTNIVFSAIIFGGLMEKNLNILLAKIDIDFLIFRLLLLVIKTY